MLGIANKAMVFRILGMFSLILLVVFSTIAIPNVANASPNIAGVDTQKNVGEKRQKKKTVKCAKLTPTALFLHPYAGVGGPYFLLEFQNILKNMGWEVIVPTAREETGRVWDINPGSPDVKELSRLVRNIPCRDPNRTVVMGHSMGGHMTSTMICETKLFSAAVPIAGVMTTPSCRIGKTRVLAFHGAVDNVIYLNGAVTESLYPVIPTWARVDRFKVLSRMARKAQYAGCKTRYATPKTEQVYESRVLYNFGCGMQMIVDPVGWHEWPDWANSDIIKFLTRR